jgi:nucleoside-diphosphate-sugar epimerase
VAGKQALIGYTGFVGGNLKSQGSFTDFFNTKNITDIDGQQFDLVVSSATPAEMWKANQEPEADMASIQALIDHLATVKARRFVLISTIATYAHPTSVNEDSDLVTAEATPYGAHRAKLEAFCRQTFDQLVVVRLPGLFGNGLKKNVIYDFLHHNDVAKIDSRAVYQFYNLDRIWADIKVALDNQLPLVNLAVEPTSVAEVARHGFGLAFDQHTLPDDKLPYFDMHTKYAGLYGQNGNYIETKDQVLAGIKAFVDRERS